MKKYNAEELREILELHKKWLNDEEGGVIANLSSANLSFADLSSANLSFADLRSANLSFADLSSANLSFADLSSANLSFADLRSADLSSANLRYADLSFADLSSAVGEMKFVKSLQCEKYMITYTADKMSIGCQKHSIEEWKKFDDKKIKSMDSGALEWWTKWKPIIMQIIEISPAEPTK